MRAARIAAVALVVALLAPATAFAAKAPAGRSYTVQPGDNLETIALCEAVYAAAQEHRVTTVREFL